MLKLTARATLMGLALTAQPGAAQALGPDAVHCRSGAGGPAVLVRVDGFKARSGSIRVNVYDSAATFLERGRYVRQVNVPVTRSGPMPICVRLPRSGQYAVAVRHDVDGDGSDWGDGGGYSRNPRLSLTNLRPNFRTVDFTVGDAVQSVPVVLNYRFGLSVRPVRG
jgi:uncharacterized protein (DUF2141 family)